MTPKKKMMTQRGYQQLAGEYDRLFRVDRPRVVQGVADAAAEGDRSENAEYIYGKKRLREIDKRLQYLASLLKDVTVVDPSTLTGDVVCFGATVCVVDEDGREKTWMLVGEGEADATQGTITWTAPMASALMGKRVGDIVTVYRPAGEIEIEILSITFA